MLVNAAVTGLAGGACMAAAVMALRLRDDAHRDAAFAVLAVVGVHLLLAGARQAVAFLSMERPALVALDGALFVAASYVGALTVIPLAYLVLVRSGVARVGAKGIAAAYVLIAVVGLTAFTHGGIDGPVVSEWGTDWSLRSGQARVMLAFLFAVPAFAASMWLVGDGARRDPRGPFLLGLALLVYYAAMMPDAFGLDGMLLLGARLAAGISGVLAFGASLQRRAVATTPVPA